MHLYYFQEAWRSLRRHRGLAITSIFSLTAALAVCGVFLLLAHNAAVTMRLVANRREVVVYLRDEVTRTQRDELIGRLRQLYGEVAYVSKEEAWQEFAEQIGDPSLLEAVDGNPLPASLRIQLRPELLNYRAMEEISRQLAAFPEVEDVRFGGDWIRRLDDVVRGLRHGATGVGLVVAIGVVLILYNTIRFTIIARRPQVEIMTRLGASDHFIATPFVIEAVGQAVLATLLAFGIVLAFHRAFVAQVVSLSFLPWSWLGLFLAAAIALAWLAATFAIGRTLRSAGP
jgi:cell division transport system permease protein